MQSTLCLCSCCHQAHPLGAGLQASFKSVASNNVQLTLYAWAVRELLGELPHVVRGCSAC